MIPGSSLYRGTRYTGEFVIPGSSLYREVRYTGKFIIPGNSLYTATCVCMYNCVLLMTFDVLYTQDIRRKSFKYIVNMFASFKAMNN